MTRFYNFMQLNSEDLRCKGVRRLVNRGMKLHDAELVTDNVLFKMCIALRFKDWSDKQFFGFFWVSLKNEFYNENRTKSKRKTDSSDFQNNSDDNNNSSNDHHEIESKLELDNVLEIARRLFSPRDYEIILKKASGYSVPEISQQTDIGNTQIYNILNNSRLTLKRYLGVIEGALISSGENIELFASSISLVV